ncbi:hypothetical protein FBEOM_13791 [Fusarium beomiforme]|uniref:2EXR domain-containing protein n=1 Tax=Fusarium beomiforme TaxID=44412 RepID=A0A9P5DS35_9HYPO|nr:hypothetical protein FBEOM_13791 [Fusarium beomiforme]
MTENTQEPATNGAFDAQPSLETFHLFMNLPYDLRRSIYVLATPRRVVRVEEGPIDIDEKRNWPKEHGSYFDYAYKRFYNQMKETPPGLTLHPDLAGFSYNWRRNIPWESYNRSHRQTCLEEYGFTSNKPRYEPWSPSDDLPRIPTDWLSDYPELAFELTRECCLYSDTEIPVFLHVCSESRETLVEWGYRLFFSTRTCEPRTWFHPGRDRLYVAYNQEYFHYYGSPQQLHNLYPCLDPGLLLTGCRWDIGQHSLDDLKQIKNVILERPADYPDQEKLVHDLQCILTILSGLEELFLESWAVDSFRSWVTDFTNGMELDLKAEPRSVACIPVEDIDVIGSAFWDRVMSYDAEEALVYTGSWHSQFNQHLERESKPRSYHEAHAESVKAYIHSWKSNVTNGPWRNIRIPTIRHVHLCPDSYSEVYLAARHRFWKALSSLNHEEIREPDFRENFLQQMKDCPTPFQIRWGRLENGVEWPQAIETAQLLNAQELVGHWIYIRQAWYLGRFDIAEPRFIKF